MAGKRIRRLNPIPSKDHPPVSDDLVRGAGELASPAYLPLEHAFYNHKVKKYDFDLEKAKDLLGGKEYEFFS